MNNVQKLMVGVLLLFAVSVVQAATSYTAYGYTCSLTGSFGKSVSCKHNASNISTPLYGEGFYGDITIIQKSGRYTCYRSVPTSTSVRCRKILEYWLNYTTELEALDLGSPVTYTDTDSDFVQDGWDSDDDNDGVPDVSDAFPLDASESVDTDNDGIGNNTDWDDDNDSVPDTIDIAPLDANNKNEITLPLDNSYKGMRLQKNVN